MTWMLLFIPGTVLFAFFLNKYVYRVDSPPEKINKKNWVRENPALPCKPKIYKSVDYHSHWTGHHVWIVSGKDRQDRWWAVKFQTYDRALTYAIKINKADWDEYYYETTGLKI